MHLFTPSIYTTHLPPPQGMGKTVITLSLILANPAPDPTDISPEDAATHWGAFPPPLLPSAAATEKVAKMPKSRGTVVVCPVSLVGQWVSEAKSKMSDGCPLKVGSDRCQRTATVTATVSCGQQCVLIVL